MGMSQKRGPSLVNGKQMSQPAPAAGFGPESVLGRYAPESVYLLGAGRAILLQLALAPVGHGVARHSNFATNPVGRLHGTLTYVYALSNGTEEQRAKVREMVNAAHAPVRSPVGRGRITSGLFGTGSAIAIVGRCDALRFGHANP